MKGTEDQLYSVTLRGLKQIGAVDTQRVYIARVQGAMEDHKFAISVECDIPYVAAATCTRC